MKHNLSESYLQSLTEEQRIAEMKEWTASEWQQYYCPNGTITLEEFRQMLYDRVKEMVIEKYGNDASLVKPEDDSGSSGSPEKSS